MIEPDLTATPLRHDEQANEDYYDCRRSLLASSASSVRAAASEAAKAVGVKKRASSAAGSTNCDKTSSCSSDQETDDPSYCSERGGIHFSDIKLYGRDDELRRLKELYQKIVMSEEEGNAMVTMMDTSSMHSAVGSDDGRFSVESSSSSSSSSKNEHDNESGLGQVVFLPGYSGSGKSSLVREFLKQLQESETIHPPWFISGKHDEHFKADPYSAIAEGISRFITTTILPWSVIDKPDGIGDNNIDHQDDVDTTIASHNKRKEFVALQCRLNEALGEYGSILIDIIPNLTHVLGKMNHSSDAYATCSSSGSAVNTNDGDGSGGGSSSFSCSSTSNGLSNNKPKNREVKSADMLKQVFRNFMTALCTKDHPVVLFLDDLQWMDEATMDLISTLLSDVRMKHLMFIGSYRSNEVDGKDNHPISILTATLKEKGRHIEYLQLQDLSADHIGEFIADSLNMHIDEVEPLTKEIHSRTLGNIFYTMQALDELVRRNSLYYDMVMFRWQWNLEKLDTENHLSSDIVTMIKSKIMKLPKSIRHILTVAAYTRSTVDIGTLWELVTVVASSTVKRYEDLEVGLDRAVRHNLMTSRRSTDGNIAVVEYSFAHDLIQEASQSLVAAKDVNYLRLRIANALVERSLTDQGADWMLFAAIHHLNALPVEFLTKQDQSAMLRIAQINLRAAKLAIDRSAFRQAVDLVRSGVGCLEIGMKGRKWTETYGLCLELFDCLVETEFMVGNHDEAQRAVNDVLENASNEHDKLLAQFYQIEICTNGKDRSYERAVELAIECLACHGIVLPVKPSDARLVKERISLQLLQGRRSLLDMMDGQHMGDYEEKVMRLFSQLAHSALLAGNVNLCALVNITAMRRSWEQGMNIYLPNMLAYYGSVLRKQGKWTEASKIAFAAEDMLNKMCSGFAWTQGVAVVIGGVSPMQKSFSTCLDISSEAHRVGVSCGNCWWALCNAMQYSLFHFCAGLPIHAVFEAKIIHFEGQVKSSGLGASLQVAFKVYRQFVLSLRGKGGSNPTSFQGKVVHEIGTLKEFEGDARKQTLRDISIFRLMLACIYGDESCMLEMIVERFSPHPEYDIVVPRQHLRDVFLGLAAFSLARKMSDRKPSKMLVRLGRDKLNLYQKLSKMGSENAPPVLSCLKAVEKPTRDNYDKAIETCSMSGLLHLEGIMNEWCGLHLLEEESTTQEVAESYIDRAMKVYNEWGATGKVSQMKERYTFLSTARSQQSRSGSVACIPSFGGREFLHATNRRISNGL